MPIKPLLGDLELSLVQRLETVEDELLIDHEVAELEGDYLQDLDRSATRVQVEGVISGDDALQQVESLREKFKAAEPLPFAADVMNATQVTETMIADLHVRELAGQPTQFAYRLTLEEYIPPPPDETAQPEVVDQQAAADADQSQQAAEDQVGAGLGTLEVTVEAADPGEDLSRLQVRVQGQTDAGEAFDAVLDQQTDGLFTKNDVPAGQYTVSLLIPE